MENIMFDFHILHVHVEAEKILIFLTMADEGCEIILFIFSFDYLTSQNISTDLYSAFH